MNHRDTMDTERRSRDPSGARPAPGRSGIVGAGALGVSCAFAGAEPLRAGTARTPKSSRPARILPPPWPPVIDQRIVADARFFVPEGPRRKLAGGKPAQRARPPDTRSNGPCPSGASENFLPASCAQHFHHHSSPRAIFFDAPLGHGATRHRFRGQRPLGRTCPRLISSGVPPGREPGVPPRRERRAEVVQKLRRASPPPRAATGDRSRSASPAASPLRVHRVSVVHLRVSAVSLLHPESSRRRG